MFSYCPRKDYGTSVVVGEPGAGKELAAPAMWLLTGRTWKGALFGSMKSRDDLPKLVERVRDGRIPLDDFITARLPFRQIRKACDLMLDPAGNSYAFSHIGYCDKIIVKINDLFLFST